MRVRVAILCVFVCVNHHKTPSVCFLGAGTMCMVHSEFTCLSLLSIRGSWVYGNTSLYKIVRRKEREKGWRGFCRAGKKKKKKIRTRETHKVKDRSQWGRKRVQQRQRWGDWYRECFGMDARSAPARAALNPLNLAKPHSVQLSRVCTLTLLHSTARCLNTPTPSHRIAHAQQQHAAYSSGLKLICLMIKSHVWIFSSK